MTTGRVDYCTCSTAGLNEKCPRHAPKPPMPEPTPTVLDSDRKIADELYRCPDGDSCACRQPQNHAVVIERFAERIAAAREAWGVPREAVAGLVEAAERAVVYLTSGAAGGIDEPPVHVALRAALERVKEAGALHGQSSES